MIKRKFKPVLPSLREKKRYLVFEVISKNRIGFVQVGNAVMKGILNFIGQIGAAKAGIMILEDRWNEKLQRGIMKINHKSLDAVRASLLFITKIEDESVIVRSIGVSGILKKAENNYMRHMKSGHMKSD